MTVNRGQGHSALIAKFGVKAITFTGNLDLDDSSHICCP